MMIWRIGIAAAIAALLAGTAASDNASTAADFIPEQLAWTPQNGDEIRFDVLRQGKPFGTHVVRFGVASDGTITANTRVRLRAGLGPIPLYRYDLDATEEWQEGRLISLTGEVNKDGKKASVTAAADGNVIDVNGSAFEGTVPASTVPASHWNIAETEARRLLSSENGQMIDVNVRRIGREVVDVAGKPVETTKYLLNSDIDVTLWYDDDKRWVKLAFSARGQDIDYVLSAPY